jgi:hypothetical protein
LGAVRFVVCRDIILTIDFASDIDSDDEMIALLLKDEQAFDDDLREHLLIIAALQDVLNTEAEKRKRLRRGG